MGTFLLKEVESPVRLEQSSPENKKTTASLNVESTESDGFHEASEVSADDHGVETTSQGMHPGSSPRESTFEVTPPPSEQVDEVVDSPPGGPVDEAPASVVDGALFELRQEIARLRESLDQRAAAHEATIASLAASMEAMRNQQLAATMRPVLRQFVDLHGELSDGGAKARQLGRDEQAGDLDFYAQRIEDILDNFDLESVQAIPGAAFDRRAHAAVMARPAPRQEDDQTIARVVRQGFRLIGQERVLIPARVVVWKYSPDTPAPKDAGEMSGGAPQAAPCVQHPETGVPPTPTAAGADAAEVASPDPLASAE